MPSSPRGWVAWAVYVREAQSGPTAPRYEYGRFDHRTKDARETAISVLMLAEQASHSVCGNGKGYKLMLEHFAGDASWYSFNEAEQEVIRRTAREFHRVLVDARFLPGEISDTGDGDYL